MAYELPNYPNHPAFQGFAGLSGAIPMRNTTGYRGLGRSYIGEAGQYGASDIPIGPNLVSASTVTPGGSPAPSSLVESSGAAASPAIPNLSGDTTALPIGVQYLGNQRFILHQGRTRQPVADFLGRAARCSMAWRRRWPPHRAWPRPRQPVF